MLLETRTRPGNVRHLIYGLNPLISLLRQHGADVEAMLAAARIPPGAVYKLSPAQELSFTERALAQLGQPDLGLRLGPRYHLSAYGMLGLAVMTSSNLVEAFGVLFRNILMTWTYMHWSLRAADEVAIIALRKQRDLGGCHQYMIDRGLAASYTIAAEALGKRLLQSETASARVFAAQCERICAELERGGSFAELIRQHLVQLPNQLASLETIAERLCTTPRTIQRKLAVEDTSFKELLEDVRKNLSLEYLQATELSVEDIALRLGYADAPSFSHAFKRWTGKSPRSARVSS